ASLGRSVGRRRTRSAAFRRVNLLLQPRMIRFQSALETYAVTVFSADVYAYSPLVNSEAQSLIASSMSPHCHWATVSTPPAPPHSIATAPFVLIVGALEQGLPAPEKRTVPRHGSVAGAEQTQLRNDHRDRADSRRRRLGIEQRGLKLHDAWTGLVHHLVPL